MVDSGSSDDIGDTVAREFPQVRLLTTENRGFMAANNRGLETMTRTGYSFSIPIRDRGGHTRRPDLPAPTETHRRARRRQTSHARRRALPDDSAVSEHSGGYARRWARSELPSTHHGSANENSTLLSTRRKRGCDWTTGPSCSPARRHSVRAVWTRGSFSLLRGDRPLPPHSPGRLGDSAFPSANDRASRQQGGLERSVCSADCSHDVSTW